MRSAKEKKRLNAVNTSQVGVLKDLATSLTRNKMITRGFVRIKRSRLRRKSQVHTFRLCSRRKMHEKMELTPQAVLDIGFAHGSARSASSSFKCSHRTVVRSRKVAAEVSMAAQAKLCQSIRSSLAEKKPACDLQDSSALMTAVFCNLMFDETQQVDVSRVSHSRFFKLPIGRLGLQFRF